VIQKIEDGQGRPVAQPHLRYSLHVYTFDELFGDYPHLVNERTVIINITVNTVQASLQIRKWLNPDPNTAVLDIPDNASKRERNTVCGSGSCTEYYDFTVDMSISELTQFYQELGYVC
jgi:hypothetical protein